jgi:hypothetical protein
MFSPLGGFNPDDQLIPPGEDQKINDMIRVSITLFFGLLNNKHSTIAILRMNSIMPPGCKTKLMV